MYSEVFPGTGSRITNTQSLVLVQAAMDRNCMNLLVWAPPATRCGSTFIQSKFIRTGRPGPLKLRGQVTPANNEASRD